MELLEQENIINWIPENDYKWIYSNDNPAFREISESINRKRVLEGKYNPEDPDVIQRRSITKAEIDAVLDYQKNCKVYHFSSSRYNF